MVTGMNMKNYVLQNAESVVIRHVCRGLLINIQTQISVLGILTFLILPSSRCR